MHIEDLKELLRPLSPEARNDVLRAFADLENRRRDERDEDDERLRRLKQAARFRYDEGICDGVRALLPAIDALIDLGRNTQRLRNKRGRIGKGELAMYVLEPLSLIGRLVDTSLDSISVRRVPETLELQPYNPDDMEAVETECSSEYSHNTVIKCLRLGYRRGRTLIRAADVKVNIQPRHEEEHYGA